MYGHTKITPAIVTKVLAMLQTGASQWDIALALGISQASISNIKLGRITVEGLLWKDKIKAAALQEKSLATDAEGRLQKRYTAAKGLRGEDGLTPEERYQRFMAQRAQGQK